MEGMEEEYSRAGGGDGGVVDYRLVEGMVGWWITELVEGGCWWIPEWMVAVVSGVGG